MLRDLTLSSTLKNQKYMFIRARRNASGPVVPMPFFSIGGIQIEIVNQCPHLGHLIADSLDDNNEIAVRRNTRCGQINNVICYFASLDAVTKLILVNTYCSSFYGNVLWDLESPAIQDVCIAWRKELRGVWGLLFNTHCDLLPVMCCSISIFDELFRRTAQFINKCLSSYCLIISNVARHGVFLAV